MRAQAAVPLDVSLATSDLDAVQARVEALAPVASVEVTRDWPDTVHVDITERQALAVVEWEGAWRGVDDDGVLFRSYEERPADLPLLDVRAATPASALAEAATVVGNLPAELLARVRTVQVGSIDAISLLLGDGTQINWGSADESADKVEVLTLLMRSGARLRRHRPRPPHPHQVTPRDVTRRTGAGRRRRVRRPRRAVPPRRLRSRRLAGLGDVPRGLCRLFVDTPACLRRVAGR